MIIMFAKFALKAWRFLEWRMDSLEAMVRGIRSDLDSAHYSFAAELSDTMDGFSGTTATTEENLEILATSDLFQTRNVEVQRNRAVNKMASLIREHGAIPSKTPGLTFSKIFLLPSFGSAPTQ